MNTQSDSTFYTIGGTLEVDAESYVKRTADDELVEGLRSGRFCYVLTSRQMGKSSLMVRTAKKLREDGISAVVLDLTAVGTNLSIEQWYSGLLSHIGQQVGLEDELENYWLENRQLGPLQRWTNAIHKVVLAQDPRPLVIFVDEIDGVRSLQFSTDEFFAGIREIYNRRVTTPELLRLTFCLVGTATPDELISDTRNTPFNIGQKVALGDFELERAATLAKGLGHRAGGTADILDRILYWTHGHPFLTQSLCFAVAQDREVQMPAQVDEVCAALFLSREASRQDKNLVFVRNHLLEGDVHRGKLLALYRDLLKRRKVPNAEANVLVSALLLSGIARADDGFLKVRNRIYATVFNKAWARANMPDEYLQLQLRRAIRVSVAVSLLAFVLLGLALYAWQKGTEAERERNRAVAAEQVAMAEKDRADKLLSLSRFRVLYLEAENKIAEQKQRELELESQLLATTERVYRTERSIRETTARSQEQLEAIREEVKQREAQSRAQRLASESLRILNHDTSRSKEKLALLLAVAANRGNDLPEARQSLFSVLSYKALLYHRLLVYPGAVGSVDVDESGRLLGGAQDGSMFMLEDTDGNSMPSRFGQSEGWVSLLRAAPQGGLAVAGTRDGALHVFDLTRGVRTHSSQLGNTPIGALTFLDEQRVVAIDASGHAFEWNLAEDEPRRIDVDLDLTRGSVIALGSLARTLAIGGENGAIRILSFPDGEETFVLEAGKGDPIVSLAFSRDEMALASGSEDGAVRIWDLESRRSIGAPLKGHYGKVLSLAFSPSGSLLASGGFDAAALLWDVATGAPIGHLAAHDSAVRSVAFGPRGSKLITGDARGAVFVWDVDFGSWTRRACLLAGRSLTPAEWALYVGEMPYEDVCDFDG